jgi:hypothetical protein
MGAGPSDAISLGISQRGVLQNPGGATGNLSPQQKRKNSDSSDSAAASAESESTAASTGFDSAASSADSEAATSMDSGSTAAPTDASSIDASPTDSLSSTSTSSVADPSASSSDQTDAGSTTSTAAASTPASSSSSDSQASGNPVASQLLLSPTFTPVAGKVVFDPLNCRVAAPVSQLDGEFIITMAMATGQGSSLSPSSSQAGVTAQPTAVNSSLPLNGQSAAPLKRQSSTQPGSQSNVIIKMEDLNAMVQQAQTGRYLPIIAMMAEMEQSTQSLASSSELTTPIRRSKRSHHRMAMLRHE